MYPYLPAIGPFHLPFHLLNLTFGPWQAGTFGLLLWLAAVAATIVLYKNFARNGVDADAINVAALVVVAGVIGAKAWHELQMCASCNTRCARLARRDGSVRCRLRWGFWAGSATGLRGSAECWRPLRC
jgi:hypothetical protein